MCIFWIQYEYRHVTLAANHLNQDFVDVLKDTENYIQVWKYYSSELF